MMPCAVFDPGLDQEPSDFFERHGSAAEEIFFGVDEAGFRRRLVAAMMGGLMWIPEHLVPRGLVMVLMILGWVWVDSPSGYGYLLFECAMRGRPDLPSSGW